MGRRFLASEIAINLFSMGIVGKRRASIEVIGLLLLPLVCGADRNTCRPREL
jgi:hypothetical protein